MEFNVKSFDVKNERGDEDKKHIFAFNGKWFLKKTEARK